MEYFKSFSVNFFLSVLRLQNVFTIRMTKHNFKFFHRVICRIFRLFLYEIFRARYSSLARRWNYSVSLYSRLATDSVNYQHMSLPCSWDVSMTILNAFNLYVIFPRKYFVVVLLSSKRDKKEISASRRDSTWAKFLCIWITSIESIDGYTSKDDKSTETLCTVFKFLTRFRYFQIPATTLRPVKTSKLII